MVSCSSFPIIPSVSPLLLPNYSLPSLSFLPGAGAHTHPAHFPSTASTNEYFTNLLSPNPCFHRRWSLKAAAPTLHIRAAFFMPQHCPRSPELSLTLDQGLQWGLRKLLLLQKVLLAREDNNLHFSRASGAAAPSPALLSALLSALAALALSTNAFSPGCNPTLPQKPLSQLSLHQTRP